MKERLIKKFQEEINALDRELKLELPKEIKRARELGDLRENAEYSAAKERQRLVESRISMLHKRVSEIALMNVDRIPADRAGFGSTLHVIEGRTRERIVFQLVMPEDADASKGMISTTSPIGRALLNKEAGDSVKVTTPGGTREFEIVKLFTIHDEAAE
jgi:transcription elongation factor GreA